MLGITTFLLAPKILKKKYLLKLETESYTVPVKGGGSVKVSSVGLKFRAKKFSKCSTG